MNVRYVNFLCALSTCTQSYIMSSEYKIEKNLPWMLVLRDPSNQLIIFRRTKVKFLLDSLGNSERPMATTQAEGLFYTA